jgi:hypothetical protein
LIWQFGLCADLAPLQSRIQRQSAIISLIVGCFWFVKIANLVSDLVCFSFPPKWVDIGGIFVRCRWLGEMMCYIGIAQGLAVCGVDYGDD